MTIVVGIDPSLTGTGLAVIGTTPTGDPWALDPVRLHTIASRGKRSDTWDMRAARLVQLRNDTMHLIPRDTALAVLEGPAFGAQGAGQHDRSWYWGKLFDALTSLGIPVAVCPPTTRAKWATDKGNAGKADVAMAITKLWPALDIRGDDQADALCHASIGAQHLGLPVPYRVLERHKLALSKIVWP
ncbi:hypothetical protein GFY24_00860 [Nocardia sp. SYP-A9097]|uniref:hypothetical protein n=1 Tax=Nocardia sp. SYP-A9097 TaxID=2663237 RepID=UPI00129AF861|nr:hypothetical protein [Nocardia sp. SYP-A9097]MRH86028.1 hypothetical protein [Nocardia sp. SYP-A9097]